jgi:hypothetical protein
MDEAPKAKNYRKGTFVFDNFAIILPFIVAIAVAVVYSAASSAFPGLKPSINKAFDELAKQVRSTQSTHK